MEVIEKVIFTVKRLLRLVRLIINEIVKQERDLMALPFQLGSLDMEVAWKKENKSLPFTLEGFSTVQSGKSVFFFGGADDEMRESNVVYKYDVADDSFVTYRDR